MKKTKLNLLGGLLALLVCAVCAVSCNEADPDDNPSKHQHDYLKTENGSTFTMVCDCGEVADGYRIQFVYAEDGSQADADIAVSWIDENGNKFTATTNAYGYVEALTLPNDSYRIEVDRDTLPNINGVEYLFDTNLFTTQQNSIGLTISLLAIHQPTNASDETITGRLETTEDRYTIQLDKTYMATLTSADDEIWYTLQNDGCGKYTVDATLTENMNVEIYRHFANIAFVVPSPDSSADSSVANKLTYTVVYSDGTQDSTFRIKVPNAPSYPANVLFTVQVTYRPEDISIATETFIAPSRFATKPDTYLYYTEEFGTGKQIACTVDSLLPADDMEKWKDEEGGVLNDLTSQQESSMQLHDDGFYYTNDNRLIYAKLDTSSIFQGQTLADLLSYSGRLSIYQIVEYDEYERCIRRDNYFGFVQAYTALANSDGVYPLTEELKNYLSLVVKKESSSISFHSLYEMLGVYSVQINEWPQGDGSQDNPYTLALSNATLGNYKVSLADGGKAYVTLSGQMEISFTFNANIQATIGSAVYDDYLLVNGTVTVVFESKDGNAQDFVLNIDVYDDPYYLDLGANKIVANPNTIADYEFVATVAGNYDVSVSTGIITVTVKRATDDEPVIVTDTTTFALNEGESLYITVDSSLSEKTDLTIAIEENILES